MHRLALLLLIGCRTAWVAEPIANEEPPRLPVPHVPCDMPGNPEEPTFVGAAFSEAAQKLLNSPGQCRFEKDESDTVRSTARARAWCRSVSTSDLSSLRAPCLEVCLGLIDQDTVGTLHREIVTTLRALASPASCPNSSVAQRWVCAKGPKLPSTMVLSASQTGLPRVEGQFIDGGQTWILEVVQAGACGRSFNEVRQKSPTCHQEGARSVCTPTGL